MSAASAIDAALGARPTTDLATVQAIADLQQRHDAKYVLLPATVVDVIDALGPEWRVLEVANSRATAYHSTYFDDQDMGLFHDHIKARRLRYKVRTRRYGNDPTEMLEIKLKSGRDATDKRRRIRDESAPADLSVQELKWLSNSVREVYGSDSLRHLRRALGLQFVRRTLLNPQSGERLTIDTDLLASNVTATAKPVGGSVVVEVKAARRYGPTVHFLLRNSIRPLAFSKYCAAAAALHPELDQRTRDRARRSSLLSAGMPPYGPIVE